tara:strand:+ start:690 stop:1625 length:936 start_codon:yes stop_codon:yes gene_type:complete
MKLKKGCMQVNQNQLFNYFFVIILISNLFSVVHKPVGKEEKIKLKVKNKERIYYELDKDGLLYRNIGKQFNLGDSIQVSFHSRTIKAPTGKKNRNYGFNIQIDDNEPIELKYKKGGSSVTSKSRPGWNYTQSGKWFTYLPVKKENYTIKITPLKGNPVVYIRLNSKKIDTKGSFINVFETVNRQEKVKIKTEGKKISTNWYALKGSKQQQYEIEGPKKVRLFSRLEYGKLVLENNYYIIVKENGVDLGTFYFETEESSKSLIVNSDNKTSKWRSIWLNIPKGKHYYTFKLNDISKQKDQVVLIRLKEWQKD